MLIVLFIGSAIAGIGVAFGLMGVVNIVPIANASQSSH
jgi:hypothetical protein